MRKMIVLLMAILLASIATASASVSISAINFDAPGNDHQNLNGEWVRITNYGSTSVIMSGWTMSDNGNKHIYRFPQSFGLNPGASVTIYTGCGSNQQLRSIGANLKLSGTTMEIQQPL